MSIGFYSSQYTEPVVAAGADWSTWDTTLDGNWTEIAPFPLYFSENKSITSIGDKVFFVSVSGTSGSGAVNLHYFTVDDTTIVQDRAQTQLAASSSWFFQEFPRLIKVSNDTLIASYNPVKLRAINYNSSVVTPGLETTYAFSPASQRGVTISNLAEDNTFIYECLGQIVKGIVTGTGISFEHIITASPQSSTTFTDFSTYGDLANTEKGLLVLTWNNHNTADYFIYTQGIGYGSKVTLTSSAPNQAQEFLGVHNINVDKHFVKYKTSSQYPAATIVNTTTATHSNQLVLENTIAHDFTAFKLNEDYSFYIYRSGANVKACIVSTTGDPTIVSPIYILGSGFLTTNNTSLTTASKLDDNRIIVLGTYSNKTYAKVLKV